MSTMRTIDAQAAAHDRLLDMIAEYLFREAQAGRIPTSTVTDDDPDNLPVREVQHRQATRDERR